MQTTIKDSSKTRSLLSLILFVILGLAGLATLFQLWEQDIFWQIKAGREILQTFTLQKTEQWSYTAQGNAWFNYQWLATIIISFVHKLFDIEGLIFFRALLLLSLLGILLATIKKFARDQFLPVSILILPFFYSAIVPRIQMRPEFFVIVLNALLVLIWHLEKSDKFKILASALIIAISTNIHPGVVPFLILSFAAFVFKLDIPKFRKALYLSIACLCFFATPYAAGLPSFLLRHLNYESNTSLANPEYFPLSLEDFKLQDNSLFAWSWLILTAATYAGWFAQKKRDLFFLIAFTGLTLLCVKTPRAIPFAMLFAFPLLLSTATNLCQRDFFRKYLSVILSFCFLWHLIQVITCPSPIGLSLYDYDLPQTTLRFIKEHKPQKNILHAPSYGDYLLNELPDYPVFFDSREIPYDQMQKEVRAMFELPPLMMTFLEKYKINTVLVPMNFILAPSVNGASRRESFFNPSNWAVVSFDQTSMLLLKRIPEHKELIALYEYKNALPDKPMNLNSEETKKELARCRQENPRLPFCQQ